MCRWTEHRIDNLVGYARRVHCGLILNGGFVEERAPDTLTITNYNILGEINAGSYLARRSSEDMRSSSDRYHGHPVMLQAATQGAIPTGGPLSRRFKPGNREQMNKVEYEREQSKQLRGRLQRKIEHLRERQWALLGRGEEDLADTLDYEKDRYGRLLELMETKRDNPESRKH